MFTHSCFTIFAIISKNKIYIFYQQLEKQPNVFLKIFFSAVQMLYVQRFVLLRLTIKIITLVVDLLI